MSAAEKKQIKTMHHELEFQLAMRIKGPRYFGSVESCKTSKNVCLIVLTCPDVDALVKKLDPWLNYLQWTGEAVGVKRYGASDAEDAKETKLKLRFAPRKKA